MSSPSSRIRPAEGRSTPVSRLITVVLPAPLGPISAWRAPFSTLSETPATAAMPPKCFSRSMVCRTTGISGPLLRLPQRLPADLPCGAGGASELSNAVVERLEPFLNVAVADTDQQHDQRALEEREAEPITEGEHNDRDQCAVDAAEQHQHDQQKPDPVLPVLRIEGG